MVDKDPADCLQLADLESIFIDMVLGAR